MSWKIPLFKIYSDDTDIQSVTDTIRSGMNWAIGPKIDQFEHDLSGFIGSKYCTTFNSGTSALHSLLLATGIGPGDEVIVPSFTFIATANAPLFVGAKPVFADIEKHTFGLDPQDVLEKITPKTRAILPIHYGGSPCRIREIQEIARDHNLLLFEDAAESLGAKAGNRNVGTFGDAALLSFCQNKIITTGEGGAIVTDSRDIQEKLKLIRSHGRVETCDYFSSAELFDYITLGYNFRMSNITAALGVAQLKKIGTIIDLRRNLAKRYFLKLKTCGENLQFNNPPQDNFDVYQLFSVRVKNRDNLINHLAAEGIMTKIYFPPVHTTNFYKDVLKYSCDLPVTSEVSSDIISLPFFPTMSDIELDLVADAIKTYYQVN